MDKLLFGQNRIDLVPEMPGRTLRRTDDRYSGQNGNQASLCPKVQNQMMIFNFIKTNLIFKLRLKKPVWVEKLITSLGDPIQQFYKELVSLNLKITQTDKSCFLFLQKDSFFQNTMSLLIFISEDEEL